MSSITDMERYVPWYLDCNRDRFPYWFGKLDSRNKILYDSLQNYFNKSFVSSLQNDGGRERDFSDSPKANFPFSLFFVLIGLGLGLGLGLANNH